MRRLGFSPLPAAVRRWMFAKDTEASGKVLIDSMSVELTRVRASEARLRQVTDIAQLLIWMSGPDSLFTYFNKPWLEFTGRSVEAERGHGWIEGIYEDDRRDYRTTYDDAFHHRRPFRMELRLRRSDGQYRSMLNIATPVHDETGAFAGYVGSCFDITDSKIADQALATLSGRLIEAQEQERSRLARELHDDINQRLALLAIELEQLRIDAPNARKELSRRINDLQQTTLEISRDVQALSHELHSSKLDFLGLVPAFTSFCREFAEQKKVEVEFSHDNVPLTVPRDISLCLFRVLQEASHNVVKHSGTRRFEVELRVTADRVYLSVRDAGRGFDAGSATSSRGLGLVSMRERLALVGGTLSIRSSLNRGTELIGEVSLSGGRRP